MKKSQTGKMHATKNYSLFRRVEANRAVDLDTKARRNLRRSMETYGFLRWYPLSCVRRNGHLVIRDGQHRLETAKELGIAVWYVVEDAEPDIAEINNTQVVWKLKDYAHKFSQAGNKHYQEAMDFAEAHGMAIGVAAQILAGGVGNACSAPSFKAGLFVVKDRSIADRVVRIYHAIHDINADVRGCNVIAAICAVCQIKGIADDRLIKGAKRYPEALKKYGSRDGYLDMLEQIYNYGRSHKDPIKIAAENVIQSRRKARQSQ